MQQTFFVLSLILAIITISGCGNTPATKDSSLRDLAFNKNAKNIALLVGAPTNLPGIDLDLNMMSEVLSGESGFTVRKSWRQSASSVIEAARAAAIDVGDDGTLVFFFSGHGAQNGQLLAESGGMLNFDHVTAAIKEARSTPLKRFMVFVDACYSGNLVNGTVAVGRDDRPDATVVALRTEDTKDDLSSLSENLTDSITESIRKDDKKYATTLTEQLLVLTAANKSTTSLAGGDGSTFTKGVWQAFRELSPKKDTTIKTFLKRVHDNTRRNSGGHHTPVYRVFPEKDVLEDLLSGSTTPGIQNPPTDSTVSNTTIDTDVALALGAPDNQGHSQVFVAGKSGLRRLLVCKGSSAACIASPVAIADFYYSQRSIPSRTVYESSTALTLGANEIYTILGIDQDNTVISASSFKLAQK